MNQRGQPPPTFVLSCIRLQFDERPGFLHPSNPEMFYSQPSQSILKISITSQFSWPSLTVSAIECLSKFRPVNLWTLFLEPPLMVPSMRKKETILSKKVNALVDKIQRDSYRDAYERFGPGPHRVQFTLELPGFSKYHTFVVELAPLSKMPTLFIYSLTKSITNFGMTAHSSSTHPM